MANKTLLQLVTDVEVALYQSAGPQVQIYSQDIIVQMIQRAFDAVFIKRYWSQFRKREVRTLNGTTGTITAPLTFIKQYSDIQYVFRDGSQRPLPKLPTDFNTINFTGGTPKFVEPSGDSNLINIYPLDSTGQILIVGRRCPDPYAMDQTVEFDSTYLVNAVAWEYFVDDGSNPGSASKHQMLMETRLRQLEMDDEQHAIQLDPFASEIPTDWYYA